MRVFLLYVKSVVLLNGVRFNIIDVELFVLKFSYLFLGKFFGLIYDYFKEKYGEDLLILILVYGLDFVVVRVSDGMVVYGFDFNEIILKF